MAKNIILTFEYDAGDWENRSSSCEEDGKPLSFNVEDWQDYLANRDILIDDLNLVNVRVKDEKMSQPMKVLTSTKTVEYYTPSPYLERVREVFDGVISLDPASCTEAQKRVQAENYFGLDHTEESNKDGLKASWDFPVNNRVTIFCNPPYNSQARHWTAKAEREYKLLNEKYESVEMIFLVNANLGYKWFDDLVDKYSICIVRDRISFITETGEVAGKAKKASAFVYMGNNHAKFEQVFSSLGVML